MTVLPLKRRLAFQIEVAPERDGVRVAPSGELDLATAEPLWDELVRLRDRGFDKLVLDLRGLTFLDSTGLRLLIRAREDALKSDRTFAVIDGVPVVSRVFDITGLREHFNFVSSSR